MSELFDIPILLDKTRQGTWPHLLPVFVNKVNTELQSRMSNAFFFFFCGNLFLVTHEPYSSDFLFFFFLLLCYLSLLWLSLSLPPKARMMYDANSFIPQSELCAIIRCSHLPRDPLLN